MSPGSSRPSCSTEPQEMVLIGAVRGFLLPVLDRRILAYFLDCLFVAHNLRERIGRWLPRWAWKPLYLKRRRNVGLGRWGEPVLETGSAGSLAASDTDPSRWALETVGIALSEDGAGLFRDTSLNGRRRARWILTSDGRGAVRESLVVFLFGEEDDQPSAVLKLRVNSKTVPSLRREWAALRRAGERLPAALRASVPRPLAFRRSAANEALLMSCLPGRSAYVEMHSDLAPRRRVARHFRAAAEWLAAFHLATRLPRAFAVERAGAAALVSYQGVQGNAPRLDLGWYDELRERCLRVPLWLAASHGDFWARNLLLEGRGDALPAVVDWEHFSEQAPPFEDLFHFPLTYGLNYPWSRYRRCLPDQAFRRTFLEDNHVSLAVRLYFAAYCAQSGLDPKVLRPLFHLYLLSRFRSESSRSDAVDRACWLRWHEMLRIAGRSVFSG